MLTAAEMLTVLKRMTADQPFRPDRTSQEEIDSTLEHRAEARRDARREPSSEADGEYWAARWSA